MFIYKARKFFLFSLALLLSTNILGQGQNQFEEIKKLMNQQEDSWNRGDIPSYMQHYLNSDSMMFVGKKGVTYGFTSTLNNYLKSYPDKASMGKLTFDNLSYKYIDKNHLIVIGSWQIQREKGNIGGYFSLLWQKIRGKWKIIIDHTS